MPGYDCDTPNHWFHGKRIAFLSAVLGLLAMMEDFGGVKTIRQATERLGITKSLSATPNPYVLLNDYILAKNERDRTREKYATEAKSVQKGTTLDIVTLMNAADSLRAAEDAFKTTHDQMVAGIKAQCKASDISPDLLLATVETIQPADPEEVATTVASLKGTKK